MIHSLEQVFKVKATAGIAAILVIALVLFTPTLAAFADSSYASHPRIKIREGTSANWAGYAAESSISSPANGFVNSVSGSWVVPTLTCGISNTYVATWVGIDGYSDKTVEQTGTEQNCVGGVQNNYAWYEAYPKTSHVIVHGMIIHAGDTMSSSVTYTGHSQFQVLITDVTTGESFHHKITIKGASRQSAEWITEAPYSGGILPLANFGTINFSNSQFTDNTGTTHAIDGRGAGTYDAITMNDPNGGNATPSALVDSGTSSSFSVMYSP